MIYLYTHVCASLRGFRALCKRALLHHGLHPGAGQRGRVSPLYPKQLNPLQNPARGQGRINFKSHHQTQGFRSLSNQEVLRISAVFNSS